MFVLICRDTYAVFLRQLQLMAASSLSSLGRREVGRVTGLLGLMEAAIHIAATSPDMLRIEGEEEGGGEESKFTPLLRSLILLWFPPSSQNPFPPSLHLTPHTYTTHIHTPTLINMPHTQTHTHTYTHLHHSYICTHTAQLLPRQPPAPPSSAHLAPCNRNAHPPPPLPLQLGG